jgi:alpha-galactosidase
MSFKIAFIGAGSIGFTRGLLRDVLSVPEFADVEVAFTDMSKTNLGMVTKLCQRDIDENGLKIKIEATTDRREAFKGARYIFSVVRIGGLDAFKMDVDIPLKYGVDQCVGDTLCAGGIMYGQRGIAAMLDFCKDIREVAEPNALLINYANPMAMMTWAANKFGGVRCVGLCHGVQHGHGQLVEVIKLLVNGNKKEGDRGYRPIAKKEVDIVCAGINHQTWYTSVRYDGKDWTDRLLEGFERHPEYSKTEKVRIDMLRRFGYYSTESNGHLSEYLAWYRKRPGEINDWIDLSDWINGETGGYLRVCTEGRNWFETDFPNWLKEPAFVYAEDKRSEEHGSRIIEGLETGRVYRGHFNVVNGTTITNIPSDAIVEVPGYVDHNGINIPRVGDLPMACAAICSQSVSVQRLSVEAAVQGDPTLLRQAMLLDPLVGAVCNPPEVWQMADEMLVAEAKWLPQYAKSVRDAKKRLASGNLIKTKEGYAGAARLHVKTVEEMAKNKADARRNAGEADKAKKAGATK